MNTSATLMSIWSFGGQVLGILYFLVRVVSYIVRSSVAVYGHYDRETVDPVTGDSIVRATFVLQNEEDVPVERGVRIEITIDQVDFDFIKTPIIECGVREKLAAVAMDEQRRRFVVECPHMPALDIWPIHFSTKASPENVWVTVESRQKSRFWFSEIHPQQRSLANCAELAFPPWRPAWRAGIAAILAAVLIYLFPVLHRESAIVLGSHHFTDFQLALDGTIIAALVGLALLVFLYCRRSPPPVILGYLGRSDGEEVASETEAEATKRRPVP